MDKVTLRERAFEGSFFFYASSEKNRMIACRFGEHRDNSRNSQSVFLVVYMAKQQQATKPFAV